MEPTNSTNSQHSIWYHIRHPDCPCIERNRTVYLAVNAITQAAPNFLRNLRDRSIAPLSPPHEEIIGDAFQRIMDVRFDSNQFNQLAQTPLPWPNLENEFLNSGVNESNPANRKKFLEWKFSQYQNADNWIKFLSPEITFPTTVLDISQEEGASLIAFYKYNVNGSISPAPQQYNTLKKLAARIQTSIDEIQNQRQDGGEGVFIRLGSRSPKDAVYYPGNESHTKMVEFLKTGLNKLYRDEKLVNDADITHHKELALLVESATQALMVTNGDQAVDLLGNSERVFVDLLKDNDFPKLWNTKLLIRRFDSIPYHQEFRCFVYDKQLTAISQYDPTIFFPELQSEKMQAEIKNILEEFFYSKIKDTIPFDHYIIDLGIKSLDREKSKEQVLVIEINSFEPSTGEALFSWKEDLKVIQGKQSDKEPGPVVRVLTDPKKAHQFPLPEMMDLIAQIKKEFIAL